MNPVVSVDKTARVPVYTVRKVLTDDATVALSGTFIQQSMYPVILESDADVYTENGNLLLRFRKGVLNQDSIHRTYEALQDFMKQKTTDRGVASGSGKGVATGHKKPVMSNILGYFDRWSVSQKATFKHSGIKPPGACRLCTFNVKYPEKWKQVLPLIREIDTQYAELCPAEYAKQRKAAKSTPFHIASTAFSTITTNLNFRTAAHTDSGDYPEGFGNLVVIEHGSPYKGAFTGFPQYGVAVDCRQGDFLAMDVHQLHGNSPMEPADDTSQRLSLVSYLREGIVSKCRGQTMYDAERLQRRLDAWRNATRKKSRG
jgi:hypothetical protein